MIDSIGIKQPSTEINEKMLRDLGTTHRASGRNPIWFLSTADGAGLPRITIAQTPDSVFHVYAEASIPRLLYGHNARLPNTEVELLRGIEAIGEYTQERLGIPFDGPSASISKIHLARDYYLGDAASQAVFALFDRRLRRFPKRNLVAEGDAYTLYYNYASVRRNCVVCIYPKHAEVLARNGSQDALEAAQGNLRVEYRANTLVGRRSLCRRFNIENPDELLTRKINERVFGILESELRLPECIQDRESPLPKLLKTFSTTKAQRLFGFLELRRLKGDAELTKTISERRNFNAARRDCERAGVWLDLRHSQE